jgi:galactokinase
MESLEEKKSTFVNKFGQRHELISCAPGRVNLIGEHTDYNEGWVLPAAIDKVSTVLLAKNDVGIIRTYAYDLKEDFEFSMKEDRPHEGWQSYVYGVIKILGKKHIETGFDVLISGNVPFGAGLSSSASIECALAYGMNELFQLGKSKKELAFVAQGAEHNYVGVKCGIMDQYASMMGKTGHAMYLDCFTIEHEYVPLELGDYVLLLCNTNVSHSLASSAYNTRREQCEAGVAILKRHHYSIQSLRQVTEEMLHQYKNDFPDIIFQRCLYVVQENDRVKKCVKALRKGDLKALGLYMYASHRGLSEMYEVSCVELDFLVNQTKGNKNILGSRMMGGGFGGCTINIIHKDEVNEFIEKVKPIYFNEFKKEMTTYIANIGNGARVFSE